MKKILSIACIIAAAVTFSSCKDFLDVKPSNQGDSSTSISSASDAEVMINGLMSKMSSSSYYGRDFLLYGDAKGGDVTIYTAGFGGDDLYYFSHSQTSSARSGYWSQIYNCILQANNIITNIYALQEAGSTEDFDNYLGQALTARGMMHFDLVRLYGKPYNMDKSSLGVPIVTEMLDANAQPTRSSVEAVYTQILNDLTKGATLISKSKMNGYLNYYANQAILAKVYMYMDNFTEAYNCCKNVIGGPYSLYSNSEWVDSWKSEFGKESIFELAMVMDEGDLGSGSLGFYYRRRGHGSTSAYGNFLASKYWLGIMGANDIRMGIMAYDEYEDESGIDHKGACYKHCGSTRLEGDGKGNSTAVNVKVIRLSEVYLMAAECALKTNDKTAAKDYLNAISKRDPDVAPYDETTVTEDAIILERRKELFAEGSLFFELCRLNKTITFSDDEFGNGTKSQYRETTIDRTFFRCRLPISQAEIDANPEIGKQQNEGYK